MISAGEVGAIFVVKDEASAALQKIADEFNRIQGLVDKITAAFDKIGVADGGLKAFQEALGFTAKAGEDSAKTISEAFVGVDKAVSTANKGVDTLKRSFAEAAEAARAIQKASDRIVAGGIGAGAGGAGERSSGGPHGGSFLHHISHAAESLVGGNLGSATKYIGAAAGGAVDAAFSIPGVVVGGIAYESFEKAADLDQARVLMKNKSVTDDKIAEAEKLSFSLSPQIGEPAAAVMKMLADIGTPLNKGVTGNSAIDAAESHIGIIGDALTVFRSLDGKNGTDLEKQVFDLVKTGELRNAVSSDAEFDRSISLMTQGAIANPKVGPAQWFQFISKARSAGMRSDDDWVYRLGPELITEFGAPAAGTAWSSLYQGIVSGKLTKSAMGEMDAIGAFDEHPDLVRRGKHGQIEGLHPGAFGSIGDAFTHNSSEGIRMLLEKIDTKLERDAGGKTLDDAAKKKGEEDFLTYVFGNRNAAQMALTLAEQDPRLQRGAKAADNAADVKTAAANVRAGDPNFGVAQFEAALSNLAATMGNLGMADATTSLHQLATMATGAAEALKYIADLNEKSKAFMKPLDDLAKGKFDPLNQAPALGGNHFWSGEDLSHIPDAQLASTNRASILNRGAIGPAAGGAAMGGPAPAHLAAMGVGAPVPVRIVNASHESAAMSSHVFEGRDPRSPSTIPYAYVPPPAPIVNVAPPNVQVSAPVVNVSVSVDGAPVTAAVITRIAKESRVSTGISAHDGQESYRVPDQGGIRHQ
jgi:hypothetical protein